MYKNKQVENMTKEELIQRVKYLENKYVWGLQAADFAVTHFDFDEEFEADEVHSTEELSNSEVLERTKQMIRDENFHIHDWSDYISFHEYSPELMKLFRTVHQRGL